MKLDNLSLVLKIIVLIYILFKIVKTILLYIKSDKDKSKTNKFLIVFFLEIIILSIFIYFYLL